MSLSCDFFIYLFSEACAEIKPFDRFGRMMAQNARNHARMCLLGVKIFNVVLAAGRQTTIKIIKIKQQFYCSLFVTMDNSRPKYKENFYSIFTDVIYI